MRKTTGTFPSDATRWRVLWHTVGASAFSRAVSVVFTLAQVPVALHALGSEAYGFLCTLLAFAALVNCVDFGTGPVLQTALADAFGSGEQRRLCARFASGLFLHAAIALLWLIILGALPWLMDWTALLRLGPESAPWATMGLFAAILSMTAGLPLSTAPRLALAVRMGWIPAFWTAAGNAAAWLAFVAAANLGAGFPVFACIACATPVLANALTLLHLCMSLGWTARDLVRPVREETSHLIAGAKLYAVPQLLAGLVTAALPTLLSRSGGPTAVTIYQLVQRIVGLLTQAHTLIATPFWPAFAEAAARRDHAWIKDAHRRLWQLTAGLFWPGLAVLTLCMEPLIRLWVKDVVPMPSAAFSMWMLLWSAAQMAGQNFQIFLLGLGQLRSLSLFNSAGYLLSIAGMLWGAHVSGPIGIIAGLTLGFGLGALIGMLASSRRTLKKLP